MKKNEVSVYYINEPEDILFELRRIAVSKHS